LRRTMQSAQRSLEELQTTIGAARPGIQTFSERTLPDVSALLRDLRATSEALRGVTERLEQRGIQGLLGSERLPDYRPK
jgi:phospholipid/cholesterol/gamma-HCH transport system substrate-binding protein